VDYLETNAPEAVIDCLANPAIGIVTMTITEGGYYLNNEGLANLEDETLRTEAERLAHEEQPRTVFGE
jgi:mannitol 2-dehydrogenase